MDPTNIEILNAIKEIKCDINDIKIDIKEFMPEVNDCFDAFVNNNNLVE